MINIDLKYKIPLVGKYNAMVYECPFCGKDILLDFFNHICGFAESNIGTMTVIECPKCHEKYYMHASSAYYSSFLDAVKRGKNLHFKWNEDEEEHKH